MSPCTKRVRRAHALLNSSPSTPLACGLLADVCACALVAAGVCCACGIIQRREHGRLPWRPHNWGNPHEAVGGCAKDRVRRGMFAATSSKCYAHLRADEYSMQYMYSSKHLAWQSWCITDSFISRQRIQRTSVRAQCTVVGCDIRARTCSP